MAWCLPPKLADAFLKATQDGTIDPNKLIGMKSDDRQVALAKIIGDTHAGKMNAEYDKQLKALSDELARKTGGAVTSEENDKLQVLAQRAAIEHAKPTAKMSGVSDEYTKAEKEFTKYFNSLKPASAGQTILHNLTSAARDHLLMNPAIFIKSATNTVFNHGMDMVMRRIANASLHGGAPDLAAKAYKESIATYEATGRAGTMMESAHDTGTLGEQHNFDLPSGKIEGGSFVRGVEHLTRGYAGWANTIAIKYGHQFSIVRLHAKAFFDSASVGATKYAKLALETEKNVAETGEKISPQEIKARTEEIFRDAARITPRTDAGKILREESQIQAARVISINPNVLGDTALSVKNSMNKYVTGSGDIIAPIVKIPATAIYNGIENSHFGAVLGLQDMYLARAKLASPILIDKYEGLSQYALGLQKLSRTVGSVGIAALVGSQFSPDDFRTDRYGAHYVKIGNQWLNLQIVGLINPALAGVMMIRSEGTGIAGAIGAYAHGTVSGLAEIPGVSDAVEFASSAAHGKLLKWGYDFLRERSIPSFLANAMKDRPIKRIFWGAKGLESDEDIAQDKADIAARKTGGNSGGNAAP
jgi:hypothetical protein